MLSDPYFFFSIL